MLGTKRMVKWLALMLTLVFLSTGIIPSFAKDTIYAESEPVEQSPKLVRVDSNSHPYGGGPWSQNIQYPCFTFKGGSWWSDSWAWMYNRAEHIGQYVDFIFSGTSIALYMDKLDIGGIVNIYLDGKLEAIVDTYHDGDRISEKVFQRDNLRAGVHTLRVEVAGQSIELEEGEYAYVLVRAFEYIPGDALFEVVNKDIEVEAGKDVTIKILRNKESQGLSGIYDLDIPDAWVVVSGKEFDVGSAEDEIVIHIPDDYYERYGEIKITPKSHSGQQYDDTLIVKTTNMGYVLIDKVITVYSPDYYSDIRDERIDIVFHAPGFTKAKAYSLHAPDDTNDNPYGYMKEVAYMELDVNEYGKGTFTFDATDFPYGPIAIHITAWNDNNESDDCYLQLFNYMGKHWDDPTNTIEGLPTAIVEHGLDSEMELVFLDDFTEMPTITYTGEGEDVKYAAAKPDPRNWPEYADAKFTPPNYSYKDVVNNYNPFAIVDDEYMKIETKYWGKVIEPNWGQTFTTGFLASMGTDGTGFVTKPGAAQYFEARLFLPPNPGLWPAFWTLTPDCPEGRPGHDELDILEAYMGGNPTGITFNHHVWNYDSEYKGGGGSASTNDFGNGINLAQGWHTFGMLITEDWTYYYFDDQYIEGSAHPTLDRSWTVGNYFMVNNAYRQSDADKYPGGFQRYGNTAQMYIDWVRVFQVQNKGFTPLRSKNIKVKPGDTVTIEILRADDAKGLSGTYYIDLPAGWSVESGDTFEVGSSKDTIILRVPEDYSEFEDVIRIIPTTENKQYEEIEITTITLGLYTTEIYPSLNDSDDGYIINFKFNNNSSSIFNDVTITAESDNGWTQTKTISKVYAKDFGLVSFTISSLNPYKLTNFTFNLNLTEDYAVTIERPISGLVAVKADSPIAIDGSIKDDQWKDAIPVILDQKSQTHGTWNGADDLSVESKIKWDDNYLYMVVKVKDDVHFMEENSIVNAWSADSLQISIDPARMRGPLKGGPHLSFTAALNSKTGQYGIAVDRCDYEELQLSWGQLLTKSKCVVTRDESSKTTVYTIAFDFSEILPQGYTDTRNIGISFLVNDNDGMGRKGWIQYMDGIGFGKDPALFGDLILTELTKIEDPDEDPGKDPGEGPGEDPGKDPDEDPDEEPSEESLDNDQDEDKSPKTGDKTTPILCYILASLMSLAGITVLMVRRKTL